MLIYKKTSTLAIRHVFDPEVIGTMAEAAVKDGAKHRVIRGGGWNVVPRSCRPASRCGNEPEGRNNILGFRLAAVQQ